MQNFGVKLADNYTSGAPADQSPQTWPGGKAALVVTATVYPGTATLRYKARGKDLDIQACGADGMYILDLPAGQYYLHLSGGASTALNADLVNVPQG